MNPGADTGAEQAIRLRGVRVHNLKQVDVDIPLRQLTVITGVSGAGKSSLAFNTLHAEAQRRYFQSLSPYTRQFLERVDRPDAEQIHNLPPAIGIEPHSLPRGPRTTVGTMTELVDYLRLLFVRAGALLCRQCRGEVRAATTADVLAAVDSFSPGSRFLIGFPRTIGSDSKHWLEQLREEGFVRVRLGAQVRRLEDIPANELAGAETGWVVIDRLEAGKLARDRLTDSVETAFRFGQGRLGLLLDDADLLFEQNHICPRCNIPYPPLETRLLDFNDPLGACPTCEGTGTITAGKAKSSREQTCPTCHGSRLSELAGSIELNGRTLAELCALENRELLDWLAAQQFPRVPREAALLTEQISRRLHLLHAVQLGYLPLNRPARSLSTGEAKRVRLVTALAANLVNALYILDEPTAGLHPTEIPALLDILRQLRQRGNTLVLIEHERAVIEAADYLLDLGPGAGEEGGRICYAGPPSGIVTAADSVTGRYLRAEIDSGLTERRRLMPRGSLHITDATVHNLNNLCVEIPLGVLSVITGVSGSGKSTLLEKVLAAGVTAALEHRAGPVHIRGAEPLDDVVYMNQQPLSRTGRSNPVTSIKVFDAIRELFAETTEAQVRNFTAGTFSFNQPGGRCDVCEGQGVQTVDMQFLADITVTCPECRGSRYKSAVLEVKVRSLSIAEVLNLTVREAFRFFRAQAHIEKRLKVLLDVGLDYLRLGQPLDTLSGGEAQRLKLAGHLAGSRKPHTLFLLDEPTNGLHPADVARLLDCFDRLLQTGHSLIAVENNLAFIQNADFILDLGPGAGKDGGQVVAAGTPAEVARVPESQTGQALRSLFSENNSPDLPGV